MSGGLLLSAPRATALAPRRPQPGSCSAVTDRWPNPQRPARAVQPWADVQPVWWGEKQRNQNNPPLSSRGRIILPALIGRAVSSGREAGAEVGQQPSDRSPHSQSPGRPGTISSFGCQGPSSLVVRAGGAEKPQCRASGAAPGPGDPEGEPTSLRARGSREGCLEEAGPHVEGGGHGGISMADWTPTILSLREMSSSSSFFLFSK